LGPGRDTGGGVPLVVLATHTAEITAGTKQLAAERNKLEYRSTVKSQISSTKFQLNPKFQYSMTKTDFEF
jgi:hypothetical protein